MVVKKDMKEATKPKVRIRVTVNIAKVNKAIDKLADKLHYIHYGYTADPELEELRKLFK
jgi:hypothetical protein